MAQDNNLKRSMIGCLLGTAVGDAIGLPFEGLSRRRQHRMASSIDGHHLLFGRGMVSAECFRHTERMDEYFDYTFSDWVSGFLNMMDMGTVALAFFLTLPGIPLLWYKFWVGIILLGIALVLVAGQVASRLKHIRKIRTLRMSNNNLEAKHPVSHAWLPAASIESFRKEHFPFPDPWRPITVGYPGIEIRLKGVSQPVEDLFAYSMDELRDRVFECLKERYPDKVIEETSDFES